jgi:hypothetical protein
MKKRYKSLVVIGAGALVYGIGVMFGISFLDGSMSSKANQPQTAAKSSYRPSENPEALSKWLNDIQPAAGGADQAKNNTSH